MYKANYLMMTPGPTMVRENVLRGRASFFGNPDLDPNFFVFYDELCKKTGKLFGAEKAQTIIMNGEGMLGLDSACASLTEPGDNVLVLSNGIFGEGFKGLVENYGGNVTLFETDLQKDFEIDKLRLLLEKNRNFKYATLVHCDTPSGVLNNIETICKLLKSVGILTVVDTVSAVGATRISVDEWGIDIALGGSQKAISAPSGLTIMTISDDAWKVILNRKSPIPSFYCNLSLWKNCVKEKLFPYTMPVSDLMAFDVAIDNIYKEGIDNVISRHYTAAEYVRTRLMDMGVELYLKSGYSPTVTAFYPPEGISCKEILDYMFDNFEVMLADSYSYLNQKVIRLGHMGENARFYRLDYTLKSLEKTLRALRNK